MTTHACDDQVVELDWDRLFSWLAGLCHRESASDCLPAALWLLCSSDPPAGADCGGSPAEVEAVRLLASHLAEDAECLEPGRSLPCSIQPPDPVTCHAKVMPFVAEVGAVEPAAGGQLTAGEDRTRRWQRERFRNLVRWKSRPAPLGELFPDQAQTNGRT